MVFTTTNLFKSLKCPAGTNCTLTNCIFSHEQDAGQPTTSTDDDPPPPKRRRTLQDSPVPPESELTDHQHPPLASGRRIQHEASTHREKSGPLPTSRGSLQSLKRAISPPTDASGSRASTSISSRPSEGPMHQDGPVSNSNKSLAPSTRRPAPDKEKLNPRLIPNDPAGHAKRSLYLKHLHGEMSSLNARYSAAQKDHARPGLVPQEHDLIRIALDEEEKIARDQPFVYANIIKARIAQYRRLPVDDWATQVSALFDKPVQPATEDVLASRPFETGLSPDEEALVLSRLVEKRQSDLEQYGYVVKPPSADLAAEAAAAVEASKNHEICDRCSARFQVYPDRSQAGLLTSNGSCTHHPNRVVYPARTKTDHYTGAKEPYYPCCNAGQGSIGCAVADDHVYKASHAPRLAAVLPFIETPENETPSRDEGGKVAQAVSFDCEMGYTVYGLELIRLTAVAWPSGKALVDVLVRPLGAIIDLNSRFSGIRAEHYTRAIPIDKWPSSKLPVPSRPTEATVGERDDVPQLPLVPSPQHARALLCSLLTPSTPLIGHAMENDLNAVRLCHPTIVDTVRLFPHRRGLPMRLGLRALAAQHLGRTIQAGGARGHDSLEDAQATGDLVRVKVRDTWRKLRADGWKVENGVLVEPLGQVRGPEEAEEVGHGHGSATMPDRDRKRKLGQFDGASDEQSNPVGIAAYLQRGRE